MCQLIVETIVEHIWEERVVDRWKAGVHGIGVVIHDLVSTVVLSRDLKMMWSVGYRSISLKRWASSRSKKHEWKSMKEDLMQDAAVRSNEEVLAQD